MSLRRGSVVVMAMIALVLAAGCSLDSRFTSAAMRIDVDVYRGALSKDPHAQWGELYAAVVDAGRALTTLTAIVQNAKGVPGGSEQERTTRRQRHCVGSAEQRVQFLRGSGG